MKFLMTVFAATGIALVSGVSPASPADSKTWYVYCEGNDSSANWAVFSENFWPHPLTEGYGRQVASAAKAFFESRHGVRLEGCAGVSFAEFSLAEYSRSRTAKLHKKMGDRVFFFPLPDDARPVAPAAPMKLILEMPAASDTSGPPVPAANLGKGSKPTTTLAPQRPDR